MPIIGEAVPATFQDVVIKGDPSGNKAEVNSDGQLHVVDDAELIEGGYSKDNVTDRLTHELLTEMLNVLKKIEYHLSIATDVYPPN